MKKNFNKNHIEIAYGLSSEDIQRALLGSLQFVVKSIAGSTSSNCLWLRYGTLYGDLPTFGGNIYTRAGVSKDDCHGDKYPLFYMCITQALVELIEEQCIYNCHPDNYYLEIMGDGRFYIRYQQIIGSRLVCTLKPEVLLDIELAMANHLRAFAIQNSIPVLPQAIADLQVCQAETRKILDGVNQYLDSFPFAASSQEEIVTPSVKTTQQIDVALSGELNMLVVSGDKLLLPSQHLTRYSDIKKLLTKAGGKYSSKGYFSFPSGIDPQVVLSTLTGGGKINLQQETQAFFTPLPLANHVCASVNPKGKRILEPSCGDAALVKVAIEQGAAEVVMVENCPTYINRLKLGGFDVVEKDFLALTVEDLGLFDAIVANPPFTKGQDMAHVLHMWNFLKPGGTLSTITSTSWYTGSQKKQRDFAAFLELHGAVIDELDAGAFKESGTGIRTLHVVVQKPLH